MNTGPRGGCTFLFLGIVLMTLSLVASIVLAAELPVPRPDPRPFVGESGDLNKFGRYADSYYARRWKRMCAGPARYDAMREANDLGKGNPC